MIVDMRMYALKAQATGAFEQRFAAALPARCQLSALGGFWHSDALTDQVLHLWPYEDLAQRDRVSEEARKSGHWPPNAKELIVAQHNKILKPAPFSPPLKEARLGSLYEVVTYTCRPGSVPALLERWADAVQRRAGHAPLVGCWQTVIGPLNQLVLMWAYRDAAHRRQALAEGTRQAPWPPETLDSIAAQESALYAPADFSPLH